MTPVELSYHIKGWFAQAADEQLRKSADYSPEGVVFVDLVCEAIDAELHPRQLIGVFLNKHIVALRSWCNGHALKSETIENRVQDTLAYTAMLGVWSVCEFELLEGVRQVLESRPCRCAESAGECDRCRYHGGVVRLQASTGSTSTRG